MTKLAGKKVQNPISAAKRKKLIVKTKKNPSMDRDYFEMIRPRRDESALTKELKTSAQYDLYKSRNSPDTRFNYTHQKDEVKTPDRGSGAQTKLEPFKPQYEQRSLISPNEVATDMKLQTFASSLRKDSKDTQRTNRANINMRYKPDVAEQNNDLAFIDKLVSELPEFTTKKKQKAPSPPLTKKVRIKKHFSKSIQVNQGSRENLDKLKEATGMVKALLEYHSDNEPTTETP